MVIFFVDKRQSFQPLKEYVIPNCVTSTNDATIPILNVSESTLTLVKVRFLLAAFHAKKRTKIRSMARENLKKQSQICQKKPKKIKILSDVTIVPPTKQKPPNPLIPSCDSSTSQHIQ
nr:unnamed protein product [Callosobruchus analis]